MTLGTLFGLRVDIYHAVPGFAAEIALRSVTLDYLDPVDLIGLYPLQRFVPVAVDADAVNIEDRLGTRLHGHVRAQPDRSPLAPRRARDRDPLGSISYIYEKHFFKTRFDFSLSNSFFWYLNGTRRIQVETLILLAFFALLRSSLTFDVTAGCEESKFRIC